MKLDGITDKELILSLYGTQIAVFILSLFIIWLSPFQWNDIVWKGNLGQAFGYGIIFALIIIVLDYIISKVVPYRYLDDGGVNERIFQSVSVWHIFLIAAVVSVSEELLFRGVLQNIIGLWPASLLFTVIHFRYVKQWVLLLSITFVSIGLGVLVEQTGTLLPAIIAHYFIDLTLGLMIKFSIMPKRV